MLTGRVFYKHKRSFFKKRSFLDQAPLEQAKKNKVFF
jgi:hypothetical protein